MRGLENVLWNIVQGAEMENRKMFWFSPVVGSISLLVTLEEVETVCESLFFSVRMWTSQKKKEKNLLSFFLLWKFRQGFPHKNWIFGIFINHQMEKYASIEAMKSNEKPIIGSEYFILEKMLLSKRWTMCWKKQQKID